MTPDSTDEIWVVGGIPIRCHAHATKLELASDADKEAVLALVAGGMGANDSVDTVIPDPE